MYWFCIIVLNSLMRSSIFFWRQPEYFLCMISCCLQTATVLLLPLQLDSFYFFFLIWLLRLGIPCWMKVVRVGILFCSWSYRKWFQLFIIKYDGSCGFIMYDLYNTEVYSLYSHPGGSAVRIRLPMEEMQIWSLGQEDPLEKEMTTHSSILAWEFPWTEEPGRL